MYAFLLEWLIVYILDGYDKKVFLKLLILIIPSWGEGIFDDGGGGEGPEFNEKNILNVISYI